MTDEDIIDVEAIEDVEPIGAIIKRVEFDKPLTAADVVDQVQLIQQVMAQVMKPETHYGIIPGTPKPTLYQPGAEKLAVTFHLSQRVDQETIIDLPNEHREYRYIVGLYQGNYLVGQAVGSATTMESKWRYRKGDPIGTGQPLPSNYWELKKSDPAAAAKAIGGSGYGALPIMPNGKPADKGKGEKGQWQIVKYQDKVENPNPADLWNTAQKIAFKRAYVNAVIKATASSDLFTQDLEDMAANDKAAMQGATVPVAQPEPEPKVNAGVPSDPMLDDNAIKELEALLESSSLDRPGLETIISNSTGGVVTNLEQVRMKNFGKVKDLIRQHPVI